MTIKSNYQYDYIIFIGRFQPPHNGHIHVIEQALEKSKKLILILGSAQESRTIKNPLTVEKRKEIFYKIFESNQKIQANRVHIISIPDYPDSNDKWIKSINDKVMEIAKEDSKIALIGHYKDESSYYTDLFPYEFIDIGFYHNINAKDLRQACIEGNLHKVSSLAPSYSLESLQEALVHIKDNQ